MSFRSQYFVSAVVAAALLVAGCTAEEPEAGQLTLPAIETDTTAAGQEGELTETTVVENVAPTGPRERLVEVVDEASLGTPEGTWVTQSELFFVWGVASDDVLNVRSGPGVANGIVATIAPNSGDLVLFDAVERVGTSNWLPVEITDGKVGWVNGRFLRPQPPEGSPIIIGSAGDEVRQLLVQTLDSLDDPQRLSTLVGSEGLTLAPFAFVGPETQTLTRQQVREGADVEYVWGSTTGKGDPIVSTVGDYLARLAMRSAITSTTDIGYDMRIGGGNSIDNLNEVFPNAVVVEYHHPGTSLYGGLNWTSVRFVFDTDGDDWVLRALVSDQWEI